MIIPGSRDNLRSYWILQDRLLLRRNTVQHSQRDVSDGNILLEVKKMINVCKTLIIKDQIFIT